MRLKKIKDQGDYPGHMLYQIVCSLQNYLRKKGVNWKLVHGTEFCKLEWILDSVMKERAAKQLGMIKKQTQVISMKFEDELWDKNILGEDTPDKLRNTVLFLLGINLALQAGDKHYALRRPCGCTSSQFTFETNSVGLRCLVLS